MSDFDTSMFVTQVVGATPTLLAILAGAVVCLTRVSRPSRARVLAGAALAVQLLSLVAMPLVMHAMTSTMRFSVIDDDPQAVAVRMALISLVSSSVQAVVLGLLLWAVFTRDDRPAAT